MMFRTLTIKWKEIAHENQTNREKDNAQIKKIIQAAIREYGNDLPDSPYYDEVLDHLAEHCQ